MMRICHILLLLAVAFSSCSRASRLPDGTYTLELYSHGDLHGNFFTTLPKIASIVQQARDSVGEENVLFIDLGDHNHGSNSAYYFNHIYRYPQGEGHLYSRIANSLKYDAIVAGNHDIEAGFENFNKIKEELQMPYLAANVIDSATRSPYLHPYAILDKNGLKIAVIGFTTPSVELWLGPEKRGGLHFERIQNMADSLVKQVNEVEKPQFTILALHSGAGDGTVSDYENVASYLASNISGVDLILAAHDHLSSISYENGVYILNSGPYGAILNNAQIRVYVKDGKIVGKNVVPVAIHTADADPSQDFLNMFTEEISEVDRFSNSPIGKTDRDIDPGKIFNSPCAYSNLLHFVQLQCTGADISFVSPTKSGNILKEGVVSWNDILQLYPFENILYKVRLKGSEIKKYLEESYSIFDDKGKTVGKPYKFDCAGGVIYEVTLSRPVGERVHIFSFTNGQKFDMDSTYSAAMVSYRANGGGGLLSKATGLESSQLGGICTGKYTDVRELLYRFFSSSVSLEATEGCAQWRLIK